MSGANASLEGSDLTDAISASMVSLYARYYGHDRTTGTTYMNDNVVVCILEDILSTTEDSQIAVGDGSDVIDGRIAFQKGMQDEFTAEIERLARRSRVAVGAIFLGFGVLKYFPGVSPAERLATDTTDVLFLGLVPPDIAIVVIATMECFIGICFLIGTGP